MENDLKKKLRRIDLEDSKRKNPGGTLIRWVIGITLTLILTFLLVPNLSLPSRQLGIGDISPKNIKTHQELLVEDKPSTLKKKSKAEKDVLALYDYDPKVIEDISNKVSLAFEAMQPPNQEERKPAISFDTTPGDKLAGKSEKSVLTERPTLPDSTLKTKEKEQETQRQKEKEDEFVKTIGIVFSEQDIEKLRSFNYTPEIGEYAIDMMKEILDRGLVSNKKLFMEEKDRGVTLRDVSSEKEQVIKDLNDIIDLEEAKSLIEKIARVKLENKPWELKDLAVKLSQNLIQPNLTFNKKETEVRKSKAAEEVKPVYFQVKKGEMIIREGERIKEEHLLKLQGIESLQKKGVLFSAFGGYFLLIAGILTLAWLYIYKFQYKLMHSNEQVLLLALLAALTIILVKISILTASAFAEASSRISLSSYLYALPFSLGAMLAVIIFHLEIGMVFTIVTPFLVGLMFKDNLGYSMVALIACLIAILRIDHYTKRWDILKNGLLISLGNMATILAINLLNNSFFTTRTIYDLMMGLAGGLVLSAFLSIVLPLLESFFQVTSDFKLLELADLNHPILRQMVVEAPGTYHHSLITGNLAEEAAEAIGASPLLARVGSYYHDIGKIRKADYFIENQFGGKNRHDKLAPSMSALILTTHVKDGVELAKEYKIPLTIRNIIKQHHGTSLISFFCNKAKEQRTNDMPEVNEEDFRYPGPKPQTKEAAIVLLADCVEAACKTLAEPTSARMQGLVQRIVNNIFIDGQLNECELTLKDLHQIAKSFLHILGGIYHHRINYPTEEHEKPARRSNGNSFPKPPKESKDSHQEVKESSQDNIRRLGLSG